MTDNTYPHIKQQEVEALFLLAGFEIEKIWPIINKYWSSADAPPWFLVKTKFGIIEIGWRKRVLSLQWEDCKLRGVITEDEVTKAEDYVHAYSFHKALHYLTTLRQEMDRFSRAPAPTAA